MNLKNLLGIDTKLIPGAPTDLLDLSADDKIKELAKVCEGILQLILILDKNNIKLQDSNTLLVGNCKELLIKLAKTNEELDNLTNRVSILENQTHDNRNS